MSCPPMLSGMRVHGRSVGTGRRFTGRTMLRIGNNNAVIAPLGSSPLACCSTQLTREAMSTMPSLHLPITLANLCKRCRNTLLPARVRKSASRHEVVMSVAINRHLLKLQRLVRKELPVSLPKHSEGGGGLATVSCKEAGQSRQISEARLLRAATLTSAGHSGFELDILARIIVLRLPKSNSHAT